MGLGEGKGRTQLNGFRVFRSLFSHAAGKAGPWELWQAGAALSFLVSLSLSLTRIMSTGHIYFIKVVKIIRPHPSSRIL